MASSESVQNFKNKPHKSENNAISLLASSMQLSWFNSSNVLRKRSVLRFWQIAIVEGVDGRDRSKLPSVSSACIICCCYSSEHHVRCNVYIYTITHTPQFQGSVNGRTFFDWRHRLPERDQAFTGCLHILTIMLFGDHRCTKT